MKGEYACGNPVILFDNASTAAVENATISGSIIWLGAALGPGVAIDAGKVTNLTVAGNTISVNAANPAIQVRSNCTSCLFSSNQIIGSIVPYNSSSTSMRIDDTSGTNWLTLNNHLNTMANGARIYLSDGTPGAVCAGGGTGSTAFRQNGVWKCF